MISENSSGKYEKLLAAREDIKAHGRESEHDKREHVFIQNIYQVFDINKYLSVNAK